MKWYQWLVRLWVASAVVYVALFVAEYALGYDTKVARDLVFVVSATLLLFRVWVLEGERKCNTNTGSK